MSDRLSHTSKTVLVLQPDGDCGPDRIAVWSADRGINLDVYSMENSSEMPSSLAGYDGLIVLGGEMGDRDTAIYPWLEDMRERFREAHRAGVPALGVCLGAQLLASALGGKVELGEPGFETGVIALRPTSDGAADPLMQGLPETFYSGSMHRDAVVRLPAESVLLATGDAYPHQAFRCGSTWGVQFHPEVSPANYEKWAEDAKVPGDLSKNAMLDETVRDFWQRDALVFPGCEQLIHNFLSLVRA